MTTWSFQSLTPHESIIPLSKLVIRKISHKTSECSCILTSFSPPKQFESVTFPTKKNKFTLTLCERCCCFATFFGSWFVQVLRTSVPRRVSHLGSKDRRMVCKATRGVYGCCTLECSIGIKKEGHIYIYTHCILYIFIQMYISPPFEMYCQCRENGNTYSEGFEDSFFLHLEWTHLDVRSKL